MAQPNKESSTERIVKTTGNCEAHTSEMQRWVERKISESKGRPFEVYIRLGMFIVPLCITFFIYVTSLERRITLNESKIEGVNVILVEIKSELSAIRKDIQEIRERLVKIEARGENK